MDNDVRFLNGSVRKFADNVEETRTVEFVISTSAEDRHGSVLNMENWNLDNFNNNGIVGYQHDVYGGGFCEAPNPDQVIGKGEAFMENGQLIGRVTFEPAENNELAEKIFRKVLFGTLKATSVGFLPLKNAEGKTGSYGRVNKQTGEVENENTYYYHGQELLEFSIVNIPSNPEALRRTMRDQTANALSYLNRALGDKYDSRQILDLTVGDAIDLLQGRELKTKNIKPETKETQTDTGNGFIPADMEAIDRNLRYVQAMCDDNETC